MAQLRSVTCHMGSHSVTCYPTQVNSPRLNPSHAGRYTRFTYPRGMEGWVDLVDLIAPRPGVEPFDSRPGRYQVTRTSDLSITTLKRSTNATTKTTSQLSTPRHWGSRFISAGVTQQKYTELLWLNRRYNLYRSPLALLLPYTLRCGGRAFDAINWELALYGHYPFVRDQ